MSVRQITPPAFVALSTTCLLTLILTGICSAQSAPDAGPKVLEGHTDPGLCRWLFDGRKTDCHCQF